MIGRGAVGAALAAAAALAGLGGAVSPTGRATPELAEAAKRTPAGQVIPGSFHDFVMRAAQARSATGRNPNRRGRWPGLGWSVAQDRRNARKRRNVLRSRRK